MGHNSEQHSHTYPVPKTMLDYRTGGTPWVVIIDKKGEVAFNNFHIHELDAVELITTLLNQ